MRSKGDDGPLGFYLRYGFVQAGDVAWDDDVAEHLLCLDLTPAAMDAGAAGAPEEDR